LFHHKYNVDITVSYNHASMLVAS